MMTAIGRVPDVWPAEERPLTVADLERTPDDGCRYELDDGMLVMYSREERPLTVADLERTPDGRCRYELDDGVLVVSPAPTNLHQRVGRKLTIVLDAVCPPGFEVLPGASVAISELHHRIPDLVVVRADLFEPVYSTRPPALVVEVASPRTRAYDRDRKKAVYERFGIASYWIVVPDPDDPSVTAFELGDGRYEQVTRVAGDEVLEAVRPFPVSVVPSRLVTPGKPL
jgi:Uma2 family endonuclease